MVQKGDRVRVVGVMANDPAPMEVGAEGTVDDVFYEGRILMDTGNAAMPFSRAVSQISVTWDNGRSLLLLPHDPFVVVKANQEGTE